MKGFIVFIIIVVFVCIVAIWIIELIRAHPNWHKIRSRFRKSHDIIDDYTWTEKTKKAPVFSVQEYLTITFDVGNEGWRIIKVIGREKRYLGSEKFENVLDAVNHLNKVGEASGVEIR